MRSWLTLALAASVGAGGVAVTAAAWSRAAAASALQFIVTSDAHYGLTRTTFRGARDVDAQVVNAALVAAMNGLPQQRFPEDGGLSGGQTIEAIDFVVETGDITNRQERHDEVSVSPGSVSWSRFVHDYIGGLTLRDRAGAPSPLYVVPGNHEASNAVGFHKSMAPPSDVQPLVEIYNRMPQPHRSKTAATFDYQADRLFFTRDVAGIHLMFLHIWPDSAMRTRMDDDLATVDAATPVMVFAHDQPDVEAKHFINPNGVHDINAADQFENLLADRFEDGSTIQTPSILEQRQFEMFLQRHRNVTAYFHGNSNWHQAYDWNGPERTARLHTFRVDSPMKGAVSALDETRLSFAVVTLDAVSRTMTVRECLWNSDPLRQPGAVAWGEATTVTLEPRPDRAQALGHMRSRRRSNS